MWPPVCMLASQKNGTLYFGVTSHRGYGSGNTKVIFLKFYVKAWRAFHGLF